MKKISAYLILLLLIIGCKPVNKNTTGDSEIGLDELTITEIHSNYTNGIYNCEQLVQAFIKRIKAKDSSINSITFINPNALAIAKKLDIEFKSTGQLRPLHGIPMIVKDNFNTEGLPSTAGSLALKDFTPEQNATMVQKLVDAGAIIIAKSNMAEWAFSPMHTESSTGGTTRNPYNTAYVPAGSSGGTAASIAANFGVIGLGSDTGNSIRGPSSHNALVGFRSTMGLTSRAGIIPLYLRNDIGGPMCRTVEDAARVLNVVVGYDPKDPITTYSKGKIEEDYTKFLVLDGLRNTRIGVLRILSDHNPDKEITDIFNKALTDMEGLGATIVDSIQIPNFSELRRNQWCDVFKQDLENYLSEFVKNDTIATLDDIARIGSKSLYAEEGVLYFRDAPNGRSSTPQIPCGNVYEDERSIAFRTTIEKVMDEMNLDALVYPTWNNKPATIEHFEEEYKGDNSQVIAPHTGQPAFTVPMGFIEENLPVGLQFLGRMYAEPILIKMTYSYEQGTKHRVKPNF